MMSTTVLDSFVLEFSLDPSKFTKGQRDLMDEMRKVQDQALRGANEVESNVKKTFDLISNMKREALTALGVFFGGRELGQFVNHITSLDAATGRLSTTLGMSAEETSAWQGAMKQAGGTAEGANAALSGLSGEMSRFQITGQSAMLPVLTRLGLSLYDSNRMLKTSGELWLDLSKAVQGMDAREATAFLQMIPGATQDMINFALMGPQAMKEYIEAAKKAGVTTAESAAAAKEYQRAIQQLDASSSNLGRTLVTMVAPAISAVSNSLARLLQSWNVKAGSAEDQTSTANSRSALISRFGSPRRILEWLGEHSPIAGDKEYTEQLATKWYGPKGADETQTARSMFAARLRAHRDRRSSAAGSSAEVEAYIRQSAAARGVNPDIAVQVYRSEGARGYIGDYGSSFGPFQLHYGGIASGKNSVSGKGDEFTKKTGLDAKDPTTWKAQVDYTMDTVKTTGWGPWHGWRGAPFAGITPRSGGGAATGKSVTVNIAGVTVNTSSGNADGISSEIDSSLRRTITAGAANYGPQ